MPTQGLHHSCFPLLRIILTGNELTTYIRGHDQDRITEIHCPPLTVGHSSIIQDLEKKIEDIRVCFLDFVKKNNRVGVAPYMLAQLTPFLITHISGRGTDQSRHAVLLHVFRHVDPHHRPFVVKEKLSQGLGKLRLAHSCRSQEQKGPNRPVLVLQSRPGPPDRIGDRPDRRPLSDNPIPKPLFHRDKLAPLPFLQPVHRDSRP